VVSWKEAVPITVISLLNTTLLANVVVPEAFPIFNAVEAPPAKLTVVAVAFTKLKVVEVVVISPPFTAKSPVNVVLPVTSKVPPNVVFPVIVSLPVICKVDPEILPDADIADPVKAPVKVVAPVTPNVPPMVALPVAVNVVPNKPADELIAPDAVIVVVVIAPFAVNIPVNVVAPEFVNVLPSNVKLASPFIVPPPVAVNTLLSVLFVIAGNIFEAVKAFVAQDDVPNNEPVMPLEADIIEAVTAPVNVGDAENTKVPVPVSSVTAAAKFAEDGVFKNVATPVPNV